MNHLSIQVTKPTLSRFPLIFSITSNSVNQSGKALNSPIRLLMLRHERKIFPAKRSKSYAFIIVLTLKRSTTRVTHVHKFKIVSIVVQKIPYQNSLTVRLCKIGKGLQHLSVNVPRVIYDWFIIRTNLVFRIIIVLPVTGCAHVFIDVQIVQNAVQTVYAPVNDVLSIGFLLNVDFFHQL